MPYQNIDNYGLIGDLHTAALVGIEGSIDWCCFPRFDSPSVFAAILDDKKGGYFKIYATSDCRHKQMYLPNTNVLVTRFLSVEGVGEVVDFMPWHDGEGRQRIIRRVRAVRGSVSFRMECVPAFDYARQSHNVSLLGRRAVFATPSLGLSLDATVALQKFGETGVAADFTLEENESHDFVLECLQDGQPQALGDVAKSARDSLSVTLGNWRKWAGKCTYKGRWREMVMRSALTLKLLIYQPTGAIIAAPTCSLPESIGGVRNWDYRYSWIRDSAFSIFALLRLGYSEEAGAFMEWLQGRASEDQDTGPLQVMYRIDGDAELEEFTLDHLDGYRGSRPVRVGNGASNQLQLDIYGELIDSIYLYNKNAAPISYDFWNYVRKLVSWLMNNWQRPDHGIWEFRKGPEQCTYSKMQCWVALDRCIRIAMQRNLPLDIEAVRSESQKIYELIMKEGWNGNSFVQTLGGDAIDATSLLFPLMKFVAPRDGRMQHTIDRVLKELVSDSLVYRYKLDRGQTDGLPGGEGTFSVCTFWLVEVLARAGRLEQARLIFEKMLTYANHLGLFAEEIGASGEAVGNFPQAFTHLGLITAALDLDHQLNLHPHLV